MRQFITICEGMVPEVDRAEIINHIVTHIHAGKSWDTEARPLGATTPLDDASAYDMASDWEIENEDIESPAFLARLQEWGEARYDEVVERLNAIPLQGGKYEIHRKLRIVGEFQPSDGLGIYWTYDVGSADFEAPWSPHDYNASREVMLHGLVDPHYVDWRLTILCNMDWMSGDREFELRLIKGSPVLLLDVDGEPVNKVFAA